MTVGALLDTLSTLPPEVKELPIVFDTFQANGAGVFTHKCADVVGITPTIVKHKGKRDMVVKLCQHEDQDADSYTIFMRRYYEACDTMGRTASRKKK